MQQNNTELSFLKVMSISDMASVADIMAAASKFCKGHSDKNLTNLLLVLRELLDNAINHGNKNLPKGEVTTIIENLGDDRFSVTVQDEGEGFDFGNLDMEIPQDLNNMRKRGYKLIHALTDCIVFENGGSRVKVEINLKE